MNPKNVKKQLLPRIAFDSKLSSCNQLEAEYKNYDNLVKRGMATD